MGFAISHLAIDDAKNQLNDFDYALIYKLSELIFCKADEVKETDFHECTEARLFNAQRELHIICGSEEKAILIEDSSNKTDGKDYRESDETICKYRLLGRYKDIGEALLIKQYLLQDEDGQTTVALTRLAGVE